MRLDINLATHPYEDAREFWVRWGLGVGVLAALTLFLLGVTVNDWGKAGRDRREIAQLQQQIAERDRERAQAQSYLDLAANRSTRDQSQFLNGLIQRKSFSWTRVFEDLEQVMPGNLHVVSLRPELNDQSQMELQMKVACDSRAAAVELVHRMEGSKHFQGAQLVDASEASQTGGVAASVTAVYVPDLIADAKDQSEKDNGDKDKRRKERSRR
ncbi:MAG: PilN domain-containing protein [Terriglobales bacterium]|jgi:Tfp pilus assembly protein PilN